MAFSLPIVAPNSKIQDYTFKPFRFQIISHDNLPNNRQFTKMDHGVASNDEYLYTYECVLSDEFVPSTVDEMAERENGFLWKYNLIANRWVQMRCRNFPKHFKFNTIILSGNVIIIYGGGGTRFSDRSTYQTFIGNLATEYTSEDRTVDFIEIPSNGGLPKNGYGQPLVLNGKYLYTVNGMSEYEYEMDVYRLDLDKKEWSSLYKARGAHPHTSYKFKHEIAFYNNRLYMFSRAQLDMAADPDVADAKMFKKIHVFNLDVNDWQYIDTSPDLQELSMDYPENRVHYAWTQCKVQPQHVYMCGGFNDKKFFTDVWRLDLSTFQWCHLIQCLLPKPTFFHTITITNAGRMYYMDGMIGSCLPNRCCDQSDRLKENRSIASAWIKIPKLTDISWDAVLHYFKDQLLAMSEENLQKMGLPYDYYRILAEAKDHITV